MRYIRFTQIVVDEERLYGLDNQGCVYQSHYDATTASYYWTPVSMEVREE